MQVENIARVGFTPRRAAQEQGNLAIGPGMLGKVIIDDQRIAPVLHELFANGAAGIRSDILQRSRLIRGSNHHDGMCHGAVLFQDADGAGHGGFFLPDGNIDADQVLAFLIDDRVNGDGRFAGLAVADDEFALAAPDGDHRINGLDAGLDRGIHILAFDHASGDAFDGTVIRELDRPFAVDRFAQGIDHPADQPIANRDRGDAPGGADVPCLRQSRSNRP